MARWGICATVRAPAAPLHAFVAHHLDLGASRIWLHFDDPADPALPSVAAVPRVQAIACDEGYWQRLCGRRPEAHQNRQSRNIQSVCARARLPWVAHLDHDEFLVADRPVARILAELPPERVLLRIAPFEALHDPGLPDDIQTARHFRGALRGPGHTADRAALYGAHAGMLTDGMLGHSAGKCFFRTGIPGLRPQIHGAFVGQDRLPGGPFAADLALLHFHAADPDDWLSHLDFRLARGAYRGRPALVAHLAHATAPERRQFYDAVQRASPALLAGLDRLGQLRRHDLGLRAKVARLFTAAQA